jgi:hypothetical protein
MARSQADTGCRSSEPSLLMSGSCCSGSQISGGSARSVSPKNPGGPTPMTVNGCPFSTSVDPTIDGSDA